MKEIPKGYKSAGVDIITGDKASKIMFEASKLTWKNRFENNLKIELLQKSFSGNRFIDLNNFPDAIIGMNFDGVGTKIEIAERVGRHDSVAFDLFAMVCDDAAILGGEPILLGSIIDFNKISLKVVRELARGMVQAARLSNVAVINGEIAELGSRVNGFGECSYNWGASTIWVGRRERMLRRGLLDPNAVIVGIQEDGLRSNGLSLIRKIFSDYYGPNWHNEIFKNKIIGEIVLAPSIIYTPLIVKLTGGYYGMPESNLFGIAHITGGGIPGKLGRVLWDTGYGAILDNLYEPTEIMLLCQSIASIPDMEAYRTWNMGNGLLIISANPEKVIETAISLNYRAKIVGKLQKGKNIIIKSKGFFRKRENFLSFSID